VKLFCSDNYGLIGVSDARSQTTITITNREETGMVGKRQADGDNDEGKTDKRPRERPSSYVVNEPRQAMVGDERLSWSSSCSRSMVSLGSPA
jgi:hypothetical protein